MKNLSLIPALLIGLFATSAHAVSSGGLFVEPMLTYEGSSKTEIEWTPALNSSSGSSEGFGLGARLGLHASEAVFLAADVRYSKPQFKDSAVNTDVGASQYNYGVTVGVQTPVLGIRIWGSYIFGGELNPDEDNSFDVKFTDAKGYRIGAGVHFAFVSLNLEYQDLKYDKTTIENGGGIITGAELDSDLTNKSYIFSVGFPLEF